MNILADFHHSDLWWSHHLILSDALGHNLFIPMGMDWFNQEYYQYDSNKSRALARQMLVGCIIFHEGKYISCETLNGCPYYPEFKPLTLEESKDANLDIIMCTVADNQKPFKKYRDKFHPSAKLVRQVGNHADIPDTSIYDNIIFSAWSSYLSSTARNKIFCHQRFDTKNIFSRKDVYNFRSIYSFLTTFRTNKEMVNFTERHLAMMPEFDFQDYGATEKCGNLSTKPQLVNKMHECTFVWHVKHSDGFGHVAHNAFATGRPLITWESYLKHASTVELLIEDGVNCLVLNHDDYEGNVKRIRDHSDPDTIQKMSKAATERFYEVIDWEKEDKELELFFSGLI